MTTVVGYGSRDGNLQDDPMYRIWKAQGKDNLYNFRIAAKQEQEHDIATLLKRYTIEETADILNIPICKVKAHVANVEEEHRRYLDTIFTGEGGYFAVFK